MNRTRLHLLPLALLLLAGRPDEGQWLPGQVREMDWDALRARGMRLTKDEFWHPERGGVLSAAIRLGGGCSASFVSKDGLVVTNHHCGYASVNALSSTEHNYLRDGFVAGSRAEELPCPGLTVSIVRRIEDVTERVKKAQAQAATDLERFTVTREEIRLIEAEGEKEPDTSCRVASFFEGREYHLYYRTVLRDVRLVYAPPAAVGEFGGEVDNWEWPRHTGDFAFFRAYAAPDGSPRAYREDNVPFRPRHHLRVSGEGVHEGDLVLILGYPGSTDRYLTAAAVADRQGIYYPLRYKLLTAILAVLEQEAARSEAKHLELASRIKSLANVQKNALGMIRGLARNGTVAGKRAEEEAFRDWVQRSAERRERFGTVLDELEHLDRQAGKTMQQDMVLGLLTSRTIAPLLATLVDLVAAAPEDPAALDADAKAALARRFGGDAATRDLTTVQVPILKILLDEARLLAEEQRLRGTELLTAADPETDTAELVDRLMASELVSGEARAELVVAGKKAVEERDDPLLALARGLAEERAAMVQRNRARAGRRIQLGTLWIEAQQAWRGKAFYPDANGTLRVSIATVKGYTPRDGVYHTPHTTVAGILEKETGEPPFRSPKALLEAAARRATSRFADAAIGDVPVCFLSDGDTTGGNSGSPVINGRGELVGLNFDRVFENVSGDYGWNPDRSRNISVDLRLVLWIMEQVFPAPHLLEELGVGG